MAKSNNERDGCLLDLALIGLGFAAWWGVLELIGYIIHETPAGIS